MLDEDLDLKAKIADVVECAAKEVIALVEAGRDGEQNSVEALPEWMTAAQLARYWQLVNASGEPITAGIMKWTKRAENEHPLPHACMGDLLRFKPEDVDRWAQEEAAFRRTERNCISQVKNSDQIEAPGRMAAITERWLPLFERRK